MKIKNFTRFKIKESFFSQVAKKLLKSENRIKEEVSLVLVGPKKIEELNFKFRKKRSPTDVLAFVIKEGNYLGEIVICPLVVKRNAKKFKEEFERELIRVFIHGLLHLIGYDHEKNLREARRMEEKEKFYLKKFLIL